MFPPLLAHQGGWDELLLTAGLVFGMLAISRFRRRTYRKPPPAASENTCLYCGAVLDPAQERCPLCGFRRTTPAS
jgi:hypothetical protein